MIIIGLLILIVGFIIGFILGIREGKFRESIENGLKEKEATEYYYE